MNAICKCITLCILFLPFAGNAFGQNDNIVLEKYRVLLTSGKRIQGQKGILTKDGIVDNTSAGTAVSIARNDIRVLDRYAGNRAATGALVGAATGLATGLLAYAMAEAQDDSDDLLEVQDDIAMGMTVVFTGVGAIVGWAVGASMKKWERVLPEPSLSFDPEFQNGKLTLTFSF